MLLQQGTVICNKRRFYCADILYNRTFDVYRKMPLLNITFWFLAGLIVGWFLATAQNDGFDTMMPALSDKTEQNTEISQLVVSGDNETENIYTEEAIEKNIIVIEKFDKAIEENNREAVFIYKQELRTGGDLTKQMRSRLIARMVRLIRLHRHQEAQQLIGAYLDSNAYDSEVLMLQARLNNILERHFDALGNVYDAKIYGDRSIEEKTIDQFIDKILTEYEKLLIEKKEWDSLVSLYSLVVEKDYSERQSSYYYKLSQAQFKLGDYYNALASLSQIVGNPLWNRKAQYFQLTIEKFIEGDGIVAIPVKYIDPHKFLAIVTINDTIEAELLIDTGASLSVLRQKFIDEVELPVKDEKPLVLTTVSDVVEARTIKLDSFGINDIKFADMSVGVTEMPDDFVPDGLLGMDFLSKFEFNLDQEDLTLYLYSL